MVSFTEFYLNVFYSWNNIIELLDIQGEIRFSDSLEAQSGPSQASKMKGLGINYICKALYLRYLREPWLLFYPFPQDISQKKRNKTSYTTKSLFIVNSLVGKISFSNLNTVDIATEDTLFAVLEYCGRSVILIN